MGYIAERYSGGVKRLHLDSGLLKVIEIAMFTACLVSRPLPHDEGHLYCNVDSVAPCSAYTQKRLHFSCGGYGFEDLDPRMLIRDLFFVCPCCHSSRRE